MSAYAVNLHPGIETVSLTLEWHQYSTVLCVLSSNAGDFLVGAVEEVEAEAEEQHKHSTGMPWRTGVCAGLYTVTNVNPPGTIRRMYRVGCSC